jgi:predicted TPR repeat methyltransferase
MLVLAQQKNIYQELKHADIVVALDDYQNQDLIIAADVLTYLGDLTELFAKVKKALAAKGLFIFTIEHTNHYPYILQTSARYAHSEKYISELASQQHFKILTQKKVTLRMQNHQPLLGSVVILQRKDGL